MFLYVNRRKEVVIADLPTGAQNILKKNSKNRPTCKIILQHEWFIQREKN